MESLTVFPGRQDIFRIAGAKIAYRFPGKDFLRKLNDEGRTFSVFALHPDRAAHHFHQVPGNRQSKARPLHGAVLPEVHPLERIEQLIHIHRPDADARIPYGHCQVQLRILRVFAVRFSTDGQADAAFVRIFHSVVQDVCDHLAYPDLVSAQAIRQGFVHIDDKLKVLLLRAETCHAAHVIQEGTEGIGSVQNLHLPLLHLRQVKNIIDDGQQVAASAPDISRIEGNIFERFLFCSLSASGSVSCAAAFPEDHLVHPQHRIDRRTDFMRHVRKKAAFRFAGLIRCLFLKFQYMSLGGLLLLVQSVNFPGQEERQYSAGRHGEDRCNEKTADQPVDVPHQFVLARGNAEIPAGILNFGYNHAARDPVVILQVNGALRSGADVVKHRPVSGGHILDVHHAVGFIVKIVCPVWVNDHPHVLIHKEGIAVLPGVHVPDNIDEHVHKDICGNHAFHLPVCRHRPGDCDDRQARI